MRSAADIIAVTASTGGVLPPIVFELLGFARRLQDLAAGTVGVWLLGDDPQAPARELARKGKVAVTALRCAAMRHYSFEAVCGVLRPALEAAQPAYVVTDHTSQGAEWAPALAARLGAGCIGGVDDLGRQGGRIWFSKDRFGGKVKGRFTTTAATTVLTVQPGCFSFQEPPSGEAVGQVRVETVSWQPERTRFLGKAPAAAAADHLAEARIIVAVGNGIGKAENLRWVQGLADRLPHAMVAGTRIVCDRGWLPYDRQVGVTGATVAPALYLACGISGASQHLMGMRASGFVVAVNTDPQAPICAEADLCIRADLTAFLPALMARIDQETG